MLFNVDKIDAATSRAQKYHTSHNARYRLLVYTQFANLIVLVKCAVHFLLMTFYFNIFNSDLIMTCLYFRSIVLMITIFFSFFIRGGRIGTPFFYKFYTLLLYLKI